MNFVIPHAESLFNNGFMLLKREAQELAGEVQNQAAIVQNPMVISEEDFNRWWGDQTRFLQKLEDLKLKWLELHKVVAENRQIQ